MQRHKIFTNYKTIDILKIFLIDQSQKNEEWIKENADPNINSRLDAIKNHKYSLSYKLDKLKNRKPTKEKQITSSSDCMALVFQSHLLGDGYSEFQVKNYGG